MQANWSELPSLPIEKIYSFLSRKDQVNMSLVCRSWSEGYGSPSVWKTFRFALTESQLSKNPCPVMKFVEKYSRMFRHVEITTFHVSEDLINKLRRHLIEFFETLTRNTQLFSVKFHNFLECFKETENSIYNDIFAAIYAFLLSQKNLERVRFIQCSFRYQNCLELLRILFHNNKMSLSHLCIQWIDRNIIGDNEWNSNAFPDPPLLSDLPNLNSLDTDYSLVFENLVKHQCNTIRNVQNIQPLAPLQLKLFYSRSVKMERGVQGLTSKDWFIMKSLYPYLEIELFLVISDSFQHELEFIIRKNMPISRLHVDFNQEVKISELFRHLRTSGTNEHLVSLKIDWHYPVQYIFCEINSFLLACKRLECLILTFWPSASGLEASLESWVENRPQTPSRVIIDVLFENDAYDLTSKTKITKRVSVLNSVGLKISVNFKEI